MFNIYAKRVHAKKYIIYRVTVFWRKLAHLYEIPTDIDLEYLESTDLKQIIDTHSLFILSNSPFWSVFDA